MKRYLVSLFFVLTLLMAFSCKNKSATPQVEEVDADTIILDADQYVRFETTMGNFTIKLYRETPLHRHNMVRNARKGFYDDQLFFGIQKNFKIQTGDINSKNAGPDKEIGIDTKEDTIQGEINPWKFYHKRGAVAQASTVQFRFSTSQQFYIITGTKNNEKALKSQENTINKRFRKVVKDSLTQFRAQEIRKLQRQNEKKKISKINQELEAQTDIIMKDRPVFSYSKEQIKEYSTGGVPSLDGLYTVFGEIIEGMDVVEKISGVSAPKKNRRPSTDIKIIRAYVLEEQEIPLQ